MELLDGIKNRRSIRKYEETAVDKEKVLNVLEGARLAQSAANRQPYGFVVVTNMDTIKKLSSTTNQEWKAPVMVALCMNPDQAWVRNDKEEYWKVDAGLTMQNFSLTAYAQGLGNCWIAAFDEKKAQKILQIKEPMRIIALTTLGYPAENKGPIINRKPLDELVHYEKW